ncbi:sensor histidine kinase [Kiloniella litopenaei]|uniref:sensor histidine kinase n=1 Tax=Kiloniella litopenaei TaxID=1549748 RepID=UPI003BAD4012
MAGKIQLPPFITSLSAKLLVLTAIFVLLAEILIFAPSIARFRYVYLQEHLADAHLAILALDATDDMMVSEDLEKELLSHVNALAVALQRPGQGRLKLMSSAEVEIDATYDLREESFFGLIKDAFVALGQTRHRVLRIVGHSPKNKDVLVEVVMSETPMRWDMYEYSWRILALSLGIALMTAALVFISLHWLMVQPLRRITRSMIRFRDSPEDATRIIAPSSRSDEVGVAESELASMQVSLQSSLGQKTRLAAIGTAAAKINHDLRNGLATARLISDRLNRSEDPEVREVAPVLLAAIDRAVHICGQMLNFSKEGAPQLDIMDFDLHELAGEVADTIQVAESVDITVQNHIPPGTNVSGDWEQLYRVFENLARNAEQAGAKTAEIRLQEELDCLIVSIADDGPGIPPEIRSNLFKPFKGSTRKNGSGLGLAITRDLMRAHGGDIWLDVSELGGACFCLELPIKSNVTSAKSQVFG